MQRNFENVLSFWFGVLKNGRASDDKNGLWYQSTPEQDQLITEQFGELHELAAAGDLDDWQASPRGSLALVILLDQMSRNMFRGTAKAFAYDDKALAYMLDGIEAGYDNEMETLEAVFYYHPLEHSEDISYQMLCVEKMKQLMKHAPDDQKDIAENGLVWAREHRDIVREFGRFPHRNKVLGRKATEQELAYLSGGGKRFGQ